VSLIRVPVSNRAVLVGSLAFGSLTSSTVEAPAAFRIAADG